MRSLKTLLPLFACIGLVTIGTSYGQATQTKAKPAAAKVEKKPANIVETAIAAKDFKTLVTALKAADLVKTLEGKGPFTVFAPSDEAFAKLPKGQLEDLLKPANQKKLAQISRSSRNSFTKGWSLRAVTFQSIVRTSSPI